MGVAETNASIFDALDVTVFAGNWSVVSTDTISQSRCNFPGQWYLITGVGVYPDDGDLRAKVYGMRWRGCRNYKKSDCIVNSDVYNHSDWCGKVYHPYVVTERVWDAQPGYTKAFLNNTTKFMGIVPDQWYYWHPYLGRPDDMPDNDVSQHTHIFGWLTIAFENASIINGTTHVANTSSVVPVYDVWDSVDGIKRYERCEDCMSCEDMYARFISMETTETIIDVDDTVRVTIDVVLKWGYYCMDCWPMNQPCKARWLNTTETARFTATTERPTIMNRSSFNCTAYITCYNNSRSPTTFIDVSPPESVIKTVYTYNNTSIIKYASLGVVHDKSVEFVNDTAIWYSDPNQTIMTRQGDRVFIRNERFNISKLNITLHTPYSMTLVDTMTTTIIEPTPARIPLLVRLFTTLGTLVIGVLYISRVVIRHI